MDKSPNLSRRKLLINGLSIALTIPCFAIAQNKQAKSQKVAIVYYSRTLNTQILAMYLQAKLGANLYRIHTEQDYPNDYRAMVVQAAREKEKRYKPTLQENLAFLDSYHTLLVGSPLWSLGLSSPIRSLLSYANLAGKNIALFITNAGFGFGNALDEAQELCPQAKWQTAFEMQFEQLEKTNRQLYLSNLTAFEKGIAFENLPYERIRVWLSGLNLA